MRRLQAEYAPRGVNLVRVAGKWMFRTANDLAWLLAREAVEPKKLSRAANETLAIIAYHQPVTRAEIEDIRGVIGVEGHARRADGDRLDPSARAAQGAGPSAHLRHHARRSWRISASRRSATCRASTS